MKRLQRAAACWAQTWQTLSGLRAHLTLVAERAGRMTPSVGRLLCPPTLLLGRLNTCPSASGARPNGHPDVSSLDVMGALVDGDRDLFADLRGG